MTHVVVQEIIQAPIDEVFAALTDPERSMTFDPDVLRVEYLTEARASAGTRFRQVRRGPRGKELTFELEMSEYAPPQRARIVTDSHGTVWDTLYAFSERPGGTQVMMTMDARAHKLLPKIMNGLMKGFFRRGISKHLADAKTHLEKPPAG